MGRLTTYIAFVTDPGIEVALIFEGRVSINRLSDLSRRAGDWDVVFKAFCHATKTPTESPRVLDVKGGSLLLILGAAPAAILALAKAYESVMTGEAKRAEARKTIADLKKIQLGTLPEETLKQIRDAAEREVAAAVEMATNATLNAHRWPQGEDRNELENRLKHAINIVSAFVHDGGRLELRFSPAPSDPILSAGRELDEALAEARKVQERIVSKTAEVEKLRADLDEPRQLRGTDSKDDNE